MDLIVRKFGNPAHMEDPTRPRQIYWLCLREPDPSGPPDYTRILKLSPTQAAALTTGPSGIGLFYGHEEDPDLPKVDYSPLLIRRNTDKGSDRPWSVEIAGEPAGNVYDSTVKTFTDMARPVFEEGEPNWTRRSIEIIDAQIAELDVKREDLIRKRTALELENMASPVSPSA